MTTLIIIKTSLYGRNEPAPKQSLDYSISISISISGLLIKVLIRFQTFYENSQYYQ